MPFPPAVLDIDLYIDLWRLLPSLAVSTALGALLGTQREMLQQRWNVQEFGGIRSFMLLSIAGFSSAVLSSAAGIWVIGLIGSATFAFLSVGYIRKCFRADQVGATSELAGVLTFLIGVLTYFNITIAIIIGVLMTFILALKDPLHQFVSRISQEEFLSTAEFILFAFVILPVLPNRAIDTWGIFNPYEFWILILVVLGVGFAGYVASKLFGNRKGLILTGILGGMVSSTAVTHTMSVRSVKDPKLTAALSSAAISASVVMALRVGLVLAFLSFSLLKEIYWPLSVLLFTTFIGLLWSLYRSWKQGKDDDGLLTQHSPFSLVQAMKFAGFVLCVLVVSFVLRQLFGVHGIYLTALLTGLVDVDAFILSMIHLTVQDPQLAIPASNAILIAVGSNMVVKALIAVIFGTRAFAWCVGTILLSGVLAAFFVVVFGLSPM